MHYIHFTKSNIISAVFLFSFPRPLPSSPTPSPSPSLSLPLPPSLMLRGIVYCTAYYAAISSSFSPHFPDTTLGGSYVIRMRFVCNSAVQTLCITDNLTITKQEMASFPHPHIPSCPIDCFFRVSPCVCSRYAVPLPSDF